MVPFLTSPLALIALIGVPALIAIYLFQRRFKTLEVSSLILWDAVKQPSMGGRKRERLRLPLSFWLEALAVVLLAGVKCTRITIQCVRHGDSVCVVSELWWYTRFNKNDWRMGN